MEAKTAAELVRDFLAIETVRRSENPYVVAPCTELDDYFFALDFVAAQDVGGVKIRYRQDFHRRSQHLGFITLRGLPNIAELQNELLLFLALECNSPEQHSVNCEP